MNNYCSFSKSYAISLDDLVLQFSSFDLLEAVLKYHPAIQKVSDVIEKKGWRLISVAFGSDIGFKKKKSIYYYISVPGKEIESWQIGCKILSGAYKGAKKTKKRVLTNIEEDKG
jgi:hypothetical protein